MKRQQSGFGLVELWLALALGLLLGAGLLQLHAGLLRGARLQDAAQALQEQEQQAWHALESGLLQLGGHDLPEQGLAPQAAVRLERGQALATTRLSDGALALVLRQRQGAGAAASSCLGGTHPQQAAGDWVAVELYYVRDGALLCWPRAFMAEGLRLVSDASAQALVGGKQQPLVQGWELEWGVAETSAPTAETLRYRAALPLPDWRGLRSLRVSLLLLEPGATVRRVSRVFALPR